MLQRGEISRARVLEIRGRRKQVLQTCDWPNLCHLEGPGYLHLQQFVSPGSWRVVNFGQMIGLGLIIIIYVLDLCRPILHRYANEDVSLGSWFIGLEVEHIDDRSMCCGTSPGMTLLITE